MNKKLISLSLIASFTLLFTACGGGASSSSYGTSNSNNDSDYSIVGRVINSYIKNATVFFDYNGDLELSEGEFRTTTDEYGRFKLNLSERDYNKAKTRQRNLIALGNGTNIFTGKAFKTKLMATPEFGSLKKPIYLTPISTFRTHLALHIAKGGFGIGFNDLDNKVSDILGVDASKYINYIKDNNIKYYKVAQIVQKAIETSGSNYEELTKKLRDANINSLDKLLNTLDKSDKIEELKTFYSDLTDNDIKTKKMAIAKAVQTEIDNKTYNFKDININQSEIDTFKDKEDLPLKNKIEAPIKKEGILYSKYNNSATIFVDKNRNLKLDANEPRVITDKNGNFTIVVEEQDIEERKSLVAINGKNEREETSKDILFQTLMANEKIYINAFTSFQTAAALAVTDNITVTGIFHSNFVDSIVKNLEVPENIFKKDDSSKDEVLTYKKSLKIKAIIRALANTYSDKKDIGLNILDAYKYLSANIVPPSQDSEFGFEKLIERFNVKNPIEKNDLSLKSIIKEIIEKYDNSTTENLNSITLKKQVEDLIEKAKKLRIEFKAAKDIEYEGLPIDQFSKYQWHLKDQGAVINTSEIRTTGSGDLGVDKLYKQGIFGRNVHVRIVDDGAEYEHEDLKSRINLNDSYNAQTEEKDPTPNIENSHGTQVAGLIGADGSNGIGVRGVAPYSTMSVYKLRTQGTSGLDYNHEELSDAWLGGSDEISIVNNSWGSTADKYIEEEELLKEGATTKRAKDRGKGKEYLGRIYLIASGNGGFNQGEVKDLVDDSVTSYFRGSQYAITVAAARNENIITQYSAQGSNVLVTGYGGGIYPRSAALMTTTTRTGQSKTTWPEDKKKAYTFAFDGTSAATPVTSGALALVIGECPNLSYRDVKWLIAKTAKKIDFDYNDKTIDGVKGVPPFKTTPEKNLDQGFGYIQNAAGLSHSNYYGYGLIDPNAMIDECKNKSFKYLPEKKEIIVKNTNMSDSNFIEENGKLKGLIRVNTPEDENDKVLDKIEWVGITVKANVKNLKKLSMVLISPSGTKSRILTNSKTALNEIIKIEEGYRFSSVAFIGEDPYGEWQLLAQSDDSSEDGKLLELKLEIVGHKGSER